MSQHIELIEDGFTAPLSDIIKDEDVKATIQDLFQGGYEAHKVEDLEDCYVIVRKELKNEK
jgi:hypothetical protein